MSSWSTRGPAGTPSSTTAPPGRWPGGERRSGGAGALLHERGGVVVGAHAGQRAVVGAVALDHRDALVGERLAAAERAARLPLQGRRPLPDGAGGEGRLQVAEDVAVVLPEPLGALRPVGLVVLVELHQHCV